MELKNADNINSALQTSKQELAEVNEDAADNDDGDCWPRDSKVMRYDQVLQEFESVPLSEIELGDEVLVVNPQTRQASRQKITYKCDHGREMQQDT